MTFIDDLRTNSLTLGTLKAGAFQAVATTSVTKNNRGQDARVTTQFAPGFPAESETIPGVGSFKKGEIIAQHQMWGPETPDGKNRCRVTTSVLADGDGLLRATIDSSTNDPSGSAGQAKAMPLEFNVGEAKGVYVVVYANGMLKIQDRAHGDYFEGTVQDLKQRDTEGEVNPVDARARILLVHTTSRAIGGVNHFAPTVNAPYLALKPARRLSTCT